MVLLLLNQAEAIAIDMPKAKTYSQSAIEEYLKDEGFGLIDPVEPGYLHMRGKIVTSGVMFDVLIKIPPHTPPEYPTFHLVNTDLVFKEPHIERPTVYPNGSTLCRLCMFDESEKTYDANPLQLFHRLYNKFLDLCESFALGSFNSKEEFFAEFDSYWQHIYPIFWDLDEEPQSPSVLSIAVLSKDKEQNVVVYDKKERIESFARVSGRKMDIAKALYFDLGDELGLPMPYTYSEFLEVLEKCGHEPTIREYSQNHSNITSILFSFTLPDGNKHRAGMVLPVMQTRIGKKVREVNRLKCFYDSFYKEQMILSGVVKLIGRDHLMMRGGNIQNKQTHEMSKKLAIIGCGSVGSPLAYKLCKSGISDMLLIDPSLLKSDNIGRHILGMKDVNHYKAEGLADFLNTQFIGLNVLGINKRAEEVVDELKNVDLIITAIGSDAPAVEPYLSNLAQTGEIPSTITCWLEADGIAGHALLSDDAMAFDLDETMESLQILNSDYAGTLVQSEVGCNSNYMPYGFIDADLHTNRMAKYILQLINGQRLRGITSIGDIGIHKLYLKKDAVEGSMEIVDEKTLHI